MEYLNNDLIENHNYIFLRKCTAHADGIYKLNEPVCIKINYITSKGGSPLKKDGAIYTSDLKRLYSQWLSDGPPF